MIVLRYQEGMELEEIAGVLDMKLSTVKTQISRALELLREKTSRRLKPKSEQPR
jgi:DNA-directed RNA polymerase specialized sigma24 family protein